MKRYGLLFLLIMVCTTTLVFAETQKSPRFKLLKRPTDASEDIVLELEKDRELVEEGNIIHVQEDDDYILKQMSLLHDHVKSYEERLAKLEKRVHKIERRRAIRQVE